MSKPRVFVAIHEDVWTNQATLPNGLTTIQTLIGMLVRLTKGFFSKAGERPIGSPASPYWHRYHTTPESLSLATEPVREGNYHVINIDAEEAGMVGVIEQLAEATFAGAKQIDLPDVEFDVAPHADPMLANVWGIVPVPQPTEDTP